MVNSKHENSTKKSQIVASASLAKITYLYAPGSALNHIDCIIALKNSNMVAWANGMNVSHTCLTIVYLISGCLLKNF